MRSVAIGRGTFARPKRRRVSPTQQVAREVDGQHDADGQHAHHHQEADDVTLEGQVMHRVLAALLPDLLVPAAGADVSRVSRKAQAEPLPVDNSLDSEDGRQPRTEALPAPKRDKKKKKTATAKSTTETVPHRLKPKRASRVKRKKRRKKQMEKCGNQGKNTQSWSKCDMRQKK